MFDDIGSKIKKLMKKDNNNIFILSKQKTEKRSKKDYNFQISNPVLMFIKNGYNEKKEINKENELNEEQLEEKIENRASLTVPKIKTEKQNHIKDNNKANKKKKFLN